MSGRLAESPSGDGRFAWALSGLSNIVMAVIRHHVASRFSEIAIHQGTVYLAGQVAEDLSQDIRAQMREVLGHIDRLLAEAGSDKSHLLFVQIYVADMTLHYAGMNEVWDAWVAEGAAPPRATVEARLYDPACLVEVVAVAAQRS
jgi:enamine deaminase RidA (YjgF/YER057c/UK114 family)